MKNPLTECNPLIVDFQGCTLRGALSAAWLSCGRGLFFITAFIIASALFDGHAGAGAGGTSGG